MPGYITPEPVAVVVLPIDGPEGVGLLVVRRAIDPGRGLLALPGGFLDTDEPWAVGAARELREETGVVVDPAALTPLWFASSTPRANRVLLYATAPPLTRLPPFAGDGETVERGVVRGTAGLADLLAFPADVTVAQRFLAECGAVRRATFRPM